MLNSVIIAVSVTLMYSAPIIFAAIGGVISERSGVVNIGIEGMMTIGAFTGAMVAYFSGNPWLGLFCGGLAGAALALLHAVASITFLADQTVSGIAINLLGPGLSVFLAKLLFEGSATTLPIPTKLPKVSFQNFFHGMATNDFSVDITAILAILAVIVAWFLLYKTKWGLRIKAIGEHPAAVDTLGVSVRGARYFCVILSGFLSGIGGGAVTLAIVSQFTPISISGQGFIALAAVIFGKWKPWGAYFACLLFGFAQSLVVQLGDSTGFVIPSSLLSMLPYVLTIIILILFVGKSAAPKASGHPYEKGVR